MKLTLVHVDTCLGCYLTDHHNRDGEMLLSCSLGQTELEAAAELVDEACADERLPEWTAIVLGQLARAAVAGADLRYIDVAGNRVESSDELHDAWLEDEPRAWFVLSWEVQR